MIAMYEMASSEVSQGRPLASPHSSYMEPIVIQRWHRILEAKDEAALEALLADDIVFQSPAVHKPQVGKPLAGTYLRAAMRVLGTPSFRYVDRWFGERSAVLEFELEIDGVSINGVDVIRWNGEDRITHFKVMIRPMKALTTVVAMMQEQLQREQTARP